MVDERHPVPRPRRSDTHPSRVWVRRGLLPRHYRPQRVATDPFGSGAAARSQRSVGRLVTLFMLAGLFAFILCGVGLTLAQREAALHEAVRDAKVMTEALGTKVVEPALPEQLVLPPATDPDLDRVMRERVLGAEITRAQLVDEGGLVVYSTDPESTGEQVTLGSDEVDALRTGGATAELDGGREPVLRSGVAGRVLIVSSGLRAPSGELLLLRTDQPYEAVWLTSRVVWQTTLPSLILGLVVLYLLKAALAYRMASSLYDVQEEREQLLVSALAAADRERTLIASDLHDGVVQGLAGASYTLSDAASSARAAGQPGTADTLAETASSLRRWVRELRSLIVTVTPPALHTEGLEVTLTDLAGTLEARGTRVQLDVSCEQLSETSESLVYRVAQEAIRNVARHARASEVHITLAEEDGWLELRIRDDGGGFDTSVSSRRQGSVGLELLAALVHERGGHLRVESLAGDGTTVTLRLPAGDAHRRPAATRTRARAAR